MAMYIQIAETDNVAVALSDLPIGQKIETVHGTTLSTERIQQGHKIALTPINKGAQIIKYGFPIGYASEEIKAGSWVHTHNMKTGLSGDNVYADMPLNSTGAEKSGLEQTSIETTDRVNVDGKNTIGTCGARPFAFSETQSLSGFYRTDGKVGIRNEIWIIPTVGCVNGIAKKLACDNQDLVKGNVDGLYALPHPFGCSQTGKDHRQTKRILVDLACHPNAGAVLVLGLGCENLTQEQFKDELGNFDENRIKFLVCQDVRDELSAGRTLLKQCAAYAESFLRQPIPIGRLTIGMKCGGSDGFSGITANPAVGRFSDKLIAMGGTTILTETPEMFGAEGMLLPRCKNQDVFQRAVNMLSSFKNYFLRHGETIYENPSPGNKAGGISTLEDKSCGCVQKGGIMPIVDVLDYSEQVSEAGLNLLSGPGNDLVSSTALAAAGAHMILFTTGRGTPFGAPVPTLKIASNSELAQKKTNWIDFDAGTVANGESLDDVANRLFELVVATACGKKAKQEEMGFREISIFKQGVVL